MSADEVMDARVHDAGQRWRDATGAVVESPGVPLDVHDLTASARLRRRRNRWAYLATAAAVLVVAGGATALIVSKDDTGNRAPVGGPGVPLSGTNWKLISIADAGGKDISVAGSPALILDDSSIKGSDGCNGFGGSVTVSGDAIMIRDLAQTEIGCTGQVQATASAVESVLSGSVTYSIDGDRLTLSRAGAGTLVYQAEQPATSVTNPKGLVGTWALSSIGTETDNGSTGSGTGTGSPDYDKIQVTFAGDGHITITHPCYENAGSVDIASGTLDITGVTLSQAIPCPSSEASLLRSENAKVDDTLQGQVTWEISDGQLKISRKTSATESTDLQFVRVSESNSGPSATEPGALLGTWTMTGYSTGGGKSSVTTSPTPTYIITFTADDKFTVTAAKGGNDLSGTYRVEGQALVFTVSGTAPQGCEAEHQLVTALTSGPTWFVKGNTMSLVLGDALAVDFAKGAGGAVQGLPGC